MEKSTLKLEADFAVWDNHVHTQLAYCADRENPVNAEQALIRAQKMGLGGLTFSEHAGQLYVASEKYWQGEFLKGHRVLVRGREEGEARIERYRALVQPMRSSSVRIGLEVECDHEGRLTLLEDDREGWDLLLGALHFPPKDIPLARYAMQYYERLIPQGIHVLAHPFRIFRALKQPVPTELYRPLARLLAAHRVAAEVNFHHNTPDPRFFEICLEEGGRISLGSDAHALHEVADLGLHLQLLREIGICAADAQKVLIAGIPSVSSD